MDITKELDNHALFKSIWNVENNLTVTQKAVMQSIFTHRNNRTFLCCPGMERISKMASLNRRTVQRTIDFLDDDNQLIRIKEVDGPRVLRTFYFATKDFLEAKAITENDDSVFYSTGDFDLFEKVEAVYYRKFPF